MTTKSKSMCSGCRDDFYNHNREGGCWMYENAKVVERIQVGIWQPPPYSKDTKRKCLSCYSPDGYSMIQLNDPRVK